MKAFLSEICIALAFGAVYFATLWIPHALPTSENWRYALSFFVFCVFATYIVIIDDERRPTRSHLFRIVTGVLAGLCIASISKLSTEGYGLAILIGGALGWFGILWAKHL
jgi:peptidoglycan/LPS O-acetylase OafA/YrhL